MTDRGDAYGKWLGNGTQTGPRKMAGIKQRDQASALQRWCLLRTSGGRALPLVKSLESGGFEIWTPVQTLTRSRGRARQRIAYDAPIMPMFVFAKARHLAELARISALPFSAHPDSSIFRRLGRVPLISDTEVAEARRVEGRSRRAALVGTRKSFVVGQPVRVSEGPGAGLSGEVVANGDGKFVLVAFGTVRRRIGAWLLGTDEGPSFDIAARADRDDRSSWPPSSPLTEACAFSNVLRHGSVVLDVVELLFFGFRLLLWRVNEWFVDQQVFRSQAEQLPDRHTFADKMLVQFDCHRQRFQPV